MTTQQKENIILKWVPIIALCLSIFLGVMGYTNTNAKTEEAVKNMDKNLNRIENNLDKKVDKNVFELVMKKLDNIEKKVDKIQEENNQ